MWRKALNEIRKTIHIWWFDFRRIVCSSRWLVITVLTFFLVKFYLADVIAFADAFDLKDYPAGLPFLFTDYGFISLAMLIVIFATSMFPVRNHLQQGILFRGGNFSWATAQFLTIISIAVLWVLEIQTFIFLVFGSNRMDLSGWKKVWGTLAAGKNLDYGFPVNVSVSQAVLDGYEPIQAILLSMLFICFTTILFGEFIFCIDGISKKYPGEIILAIWSLMWLIVDNFYTLENWKLIKLLSPKNWLDISRYAGRPDTLWRTIAVMAVLMLGFYALGMFLVKQKIIETE